MQNLKMILAAAALTFVVAVPAKALEFTETSPSITEDFDSMTKTGLTLPAGWRIDRQMVSSLTIGSYTSAAEVVMYCGGPSLASNAKNGTWNFGPDTNDRALGGLSTGIDGGTRCNNPMVKVTNSGQTAIEKLAIAFDIEKYRYGNNASGFIVQLYTSPDGSEWTSAGETFYHKFNADGSTIGAAEVPIATVHIAGDLTVDVPVGEDIYLAWNISVAAKTTSCANAQALAIDNVELTATFADPNVVKHNIFVEDCTKWSDLAVWATDGSLGEFPGLLPTGTASVNDVTYKKFVYTATAEPFDVVVNDGADRRLAAISVDGDADVYLCATVEGVSEIADPASYTGWVDPNPTEFYVRGTFTGWQAQQAWKFTYEGNGRYVLRNVTISGPFRIADDSWTVYYGSNGKNIFPDEVYNLTTTTGDIGIPGGYTPIKCAEIVLTIKDDSYTLLLRSDDSTEGLTAVYVVGDFNDWNWTDKSGALTRTQDGKFRGRVTMPEPAGGGLTHWRIYQNLAKSVSWGLEADAAEASTSGVLAQWATGNVATSPGTYNIVFDIATGQYALESPELVPTTLRIRPENAVLVPQVPAEVKVLSLNNSLIDHNQQYNIWNEIAAAAGKTAHWTNHTLLGQSLQTHWNEGTGEGSARGLVESDTWTHIILQEHSSLPRTNPADFKASVKQWVDFIRQNCPNPNAVVILAMNWGYNENNWADFSIQNAKLLQSYVDAAREAGATVCPVGVAYQQYYDALGGEETAKLYSDNRHPTLMASYMAACMEYGLIYGENPTELTYKPSGLTDEVATAMRSYAAGGLAGFDQCVDHTGRKVQYAVEVLDQFDMPMELDSAPTLTVSGGGSITDGGLFTSDGTTGEYTVTATIGQTSVQTLLTVGTAYAEAYEPEYAYLAVSERDICAFENFDGMATEGAAILPEAWRIERLTGSGDVRTVGEYGKADGQTMYSGGVNLVNNAPNGTYNYGSDSDRAVGGCTTNIDGGARSINVYTHLRNMGRADVTAFEISYDVEKYRKGNRAEGFTVQMYYSADGKNWTAAEDFKTVLERDDATAGAAVVPIATYPVASKLEVNVEPEGHLYLAWNISVTSGSNASSAMALAIDNVKISAEFGEPLYKVYIEDKTDWDAMHVYGIGADVDLEGGELFGVWPGKRHSGSMTHQERNFKTFGHYVNSGKFTLYVSDGATARPEARNGMMKAQGKVHTITIDASRDYYLTATPEEVYDIYANQTGVEGVSTGSKGYRLYGKEIIADGPIAVYDLEGRAVRSSDGGRLSTADLPAGFYIIATPAATGKLVVR